MSQGTLGNSAWAPMARLLPGNDGAAGWSARNGTPSRSLRRFGRALLISLAAGSLAVPGYAESFRMRPYV